MTTTNELRGSQAVRQCTVNAPTVGSIPTRAAKSFYWYYQDVCKGDIGRLMFTKKRYSSSEEFLMDFPDARLGFFGKDIFT